MCVDVRVRCMLTRSPMDYYKQHSYNYYNVQPVMPNNKDDRDDEVTLKRGNIIQTYDDEL